MDLGQLTYPDGYDEPSDSLRARYDRLIWMNQEVCNNCYQQVRAVGEVLEKRTATGVHRFRAYYERTEHGSQEFDPFSLPSDRYGRCYCLDCGADLRAMNDGPDRDTLIERAKNIVRYITAETDAKIDAEAVGKALRRLSIIDANQGYDGEILAAATCVGLARADAEADARRAVA